MPICPKHTIDLRGNTILLFWVVGLGSGVGNGVYHYCKAIFAPDQASSVQCEQSFLYCPSDYWSLGVRGSRLRISDKWAEKSKFMEQSFIFEKQSKFKVNTSLAAQWALIHGL